MSFNLNNNKMNAKWIESECEFCNGEGYDEDSLTEKNGVITTNYCENCDGHGVVFELELEIKP
jgi:DnaJ-class molecular chaperone